MLWLWSEMGKAPLAQALGPLARLAAMTGKPFGGQHLDDMVGAYRDEFWQVDASAREALAGLRSMADTQVVTAALKAVYVPWLEEVNRRFQDLLRKDGVEAASSRLKRQDGASTECRLFVDGLRFDVAQELSRALAAEGYEVAIGSTWAPVPSVTASGKVLCSPVGHLAKGRSTDQDFVPSHGAQDKPFNTALLRKVMKDEGWQVLGANEAGDSNGKAWTEFGDLDHYGHEHGLRLAREVPLILDAIVEQVRFLMEAGWKTIRVVTDHGWLLVPGGMPKTELAKYLTETRWGRCAALKDTASATDLTLTWTWCSDVRIAIAPGISSFVAGQEYGHGGLSLQESIIPVLQVQRAEGVADNETVKVKSIKWTGLRCRVTVEAASSRLSADKRQDGVFAKEDKRQDGASTRVDLRRKANDPATSVAVTAKALKDGKASLMVENDDLDGEAISLVVLDAQGLAIARFATVIGGEE